MKRILIAATGALVLSLVLAGGVEARCSVSCLNNRMRQLSTGLIKAEKTIASLSGTVSEQGKTIASQGTTIIQQGQALAAQGQTISQQNQKITQLTGASQETEEIFECLFEAPFTEYGEPEKELGYLFKGETKTFPTTALDFTAKGDPISAWFVFDACNETETLSTGAATGAFPRATDLRSSSSR